MRRCKKRLERFKRIWRSEDARKWSRGAKQAVKSVPLILGFNGCYRDVRASEDLYNKIR